MLPDSPSAARLLVRASQSRRSAASALAAADQHVPLALLDDLVVLVEHLDLVDHEPLGGVLVLGLLADRALDAQRVAEEDRPAELPVAQPHEGRGRRAGRRRTPWRPPRRRGTS